MAFEENGGNGMYMPVAPAYNGGNNGFGGDWAWIIILLLCGWGGMGFGGMGGYGNMALGYDFPWILNGQNNISGQMSDGFRDQMLNTSVNGIQNSITSGFGDVQTALCGGFAGVNATVNGAQNALAQQLYTNQIADMERSFAAQTANSQGLNALQGQLASCCCENRLATADTKFAIATEACANRTASASNTRDIIDSQTRGTQAILDKLCALELDAKDSKINDLERQLTMANLAASQTAQTSRILADNAAQTVALEQYLNPAPVPAYVVQNPNCCTTNTCGCGCGAF